MTSPSSKQGRRPLANPRAAIEDWLNLVDPDGAFLTVTELAVVFPHGFEPMPTEQRTELRSRVADLDENLQDEASFGVGYWQPFSIGTTCSLRTSAFPPRLLSESPSKVSASGQVRPSSMSMTPTRSESVFSIGRSALDSSAGPTSPLRATRGRRAPSSGPRPGAERAVCHSPW